MLDSRSFPIVSASELCVLPIAGTSMRDYRLLPVLLRRYGYWRIILAQIDTTWNVIVYRGLSGVLIPRIVQFETVKRDVFYCTGLLLRTENSSCLSEQLH